jgi:hypothetical protein
MAVTITSGNRREVMVVGDETADMRHSRMGAAISPVTPNCLKVSDEVWERGEERDEKMSPVAIMSEMVC